MTQAFEIYKRAKPFPSIYGASDHTFKFTLGEDDFGYEVGSKKSTLLNGNLDLTGSTVTLKVFSLPVKASLVDLARGYDDLGFCNLFSIDGTITDAENGKVQFDIEPKHIDTYGDFIGQLEVVTSTNKTIVCGQFKLSIIKRFS